ncbi:helix-turn-helix domain-containing protein [Streptosporangium canum]|uniref:helix-turn-helix domain-containing protein n=1 Tax=Streptosporangium canum TaxID=324952 RepID=UPI00367D9494
MSLSVEVHVGERVAFYRKSQGKKQAVVAGLAGIAPDYLSQIERGKRVPTVAVLHRISQILNVPVSVLLGEPAFEEHGVIHPTGKALHRVLTSYEPITPDTPAPDLADLRNRVNALWSAWQTSPTRFTHVAPLVAGLTADVQLAVRSLRASTEKDARKSVYQISSDLYFLLRTFSKRIGRPDLSMLVADRAVAAAEETDEPLRIAAAKWNMGQILLAQSEAEGAEDVAIRASEDLRRETHVPLAEKAAMEGALALVSTIAAVRKGDYWAARERLRNRALPAAKASGEGNVFWTVFGPLNVQLHALSIEVEAGETSEALRQADKIDLTRLPSAERRTTFALEVARCYDQRRDDAAVFLHLLNAEASGPEDLKYNVLARDLARGLLKRARPTYAPQVRAMAERIGLAG